MPKKAGHQLKLAARRERARLVRKRWWVLLVGLAVYAVIVIPVIRQQPGPVTSRGVWLGGAIVGLLWLVWEMVRALSHGADHLWRGAEGEEFTGDELRKLKRHARWYVIDRVEFDVLDVDHVVVGPGGVFAVESKNYSAEIDLRQPPGWLSSTSQQAHTNARKIKGLVRRHADVEVRPVVVLWGARIANVPGGCAVVHDVLYCVGRQGRHWRTAFRGNAGNALEPGKVEGVREAVQDFVEVRDRHRKTSADKLRSGTVGKSR